MHNNVEHSEAKHGGQIVQRFDVAGSSIPVVVNVVASETKMVTSPLANKYAVTLKKFMDQEQATAAALNDISHSLFDKLKNLDDARDLQPLYMYSVQSFYEFAEL